MIIDVHAHVWDRVCGIVGRNPTVSLDYGKVKCGNKTSQWMIPSYRDSASTVEILLGYMDMHGVDKSILMQEPMYGFHNDYVSSAVKKYPDRFKGFAFVNVLDGEQAIEEFEDAVNVKGLSGLKIAVSNIMNLCHSTILDGEKIVPFWRKADELKAPITFHLMHGDTNVQEINNIAKRFKNLKIIIAHLGLPPAEGWKDQVLLAKRDNVFIETSAAGVLFGERYPFPSAQESLKWAVSEIGAEKIMYGSDYPLILSQMTYGQSIDFIREECGFLSKEQKELILGEVAKRLFGF